MTQPNEKTVWETAKVVPSSTPPPAQRQQVAQSNLLDITTIEDVPIYYKALIYGDYGAGKTVFAASAADVPQMRDVLFIAADPGLTSISHRKDIDILKINTFKQLGAAYNYVRRHCIIRDTATDEELLKLDSQCRSKVPPKARRFKTVIIDSLTEVQKYCMYQLLGIQIGPSRLDEEPPRPEWSHWGSAAEMLRLLVRSFRDLPVHVIMVCSMAESEDEARRKMRYPNLPGKLSREIEGYFDVVGFLFAGQPEEGGDVARRLYIQPGKSFRAKNRFRDIKVNFLDNPTMSSFFDARR